MDTWILDAAIVTQNQNRDIIQGHLLIRDGLIAEIISKKPRASKAKKISAKGLTVFPGFIQTHIHLCQTLFRNQADDLELLDWLQKRIWPLEAHHTEETLYLSARLGIHELLSTGTTCILDMGTVKHTHAIFKAVQDTGIRASVGKCLMDHPETTPPFLREKTEQALKEAFDLFETWHGKKNDRIRVSFAPRFAVSCTENLLREIQKTASQHHALVHTHASENRAEIELVQRLVGQENIVYFENLGLTKNHLVLAHCVWLNEKEKQILKRDQVHVAHCPSSNLKLASGIAPIPELIKMGINVSLGADGAPCNNQLNALQEMRLAALIHKPAFGPKALRAQEALDLMTLNGAKALQWENDIGSIEVGKKADLVAIDLNLSENNIDFKNSESIASALVYSAHAHQIQWTLVDGKRVFKRGQRFKFDSELLKARKAFSRLIAQPSSG